jgi:nondiscriminating glutamyl-tRNA synthetase
MAGPTARTRFAPSPTGVLHVGGARTALFNWLFARNSGGAFILRFEDTDAERSSAECEAGLLEDLRWLGLDWDEGPDIGGPHVPYRQSRRLDTYHYIAARLENEGKAFKCYCTDAELRGRRERAIAEGKPAIYDGRCRRLSAAERRGFESEGRQPSLRFLVEYEDVRLQDIVRGEVHFKTGMVGDFVIVRSDGMPTYNFACVVDDSTMAVTHVIRGEEHLPNTLRQILLYRGLGLHAPAFAHLPLVLGPDRTKLSKRHGATSVAEMRRIGYPKEALVNYLALLGWSPGDDTELMTGEDLIRRFSLKRVSASPSIFDANKLEWVSSHHMKNLPPEEIADEIRPFLAGVGVDADALDRSLLLRAAAALRVASRTYADLAGKVAPLLEAPATPDGALLEKMHSEKGTKSIGLFRDTLSRVSGSDADSVRLALADVVKASGLKKGEVFLPIRVALTGRGSGPEIPVVVEVLGKPRSLELLRAAAESEAKH